MAITWGAYEDGNDSGNNIRVGIDIIVSGNTATVKYYVGTGSNAAFDDNQTMNYSGAITGSTDFYNGLGASDTKLVAEKTKSLARGDSYTFSASLSGVYSGATPSHSRTYTHPLAVPGPPSYPATPITNVTSDSATFSWIQPTDWGGDDDDDYIVQYDDNAGLTSVSTINVYNATSVVVGGLSPSTTYYIRVSASNSQGHGPWTDIISFTTAATPASAPGAPTWANPAFTNVKPTSFRANWVAPGSVGSSPITGYEFQYSLNSAFTGATTPPATTSLSYEATGLLPNTTYYVRVRAGNTAGFGAWSTANQVKTQGGAKVMKAGVWVDFPTGVRKAGVWTPIAPQKRKNGAWVF